MLLLDGSLASFSVLKTWNGVAVEAALTPRLWLHFERQNCRLGARVFQRILALPRVRSRRSTCLLLILNRPTRGTAAQHPQNACGLNRQGVSLQGGPETHRRRSPSSNTGGGTDWLLRPPPREPSTWCARTQCHRQKQDWPAGADDRIDESHLSLFLCNSRVMA